MRNSVECSVSEQSFSVLFEFSHEDNQDKLKVWRVEESEKGGKWRKTEREVKKKPPPLHSYNNEGKEEETGNGKRL